MLRPDDTGLTALCVPEVARARGIYQQCFDAGHGGIVFVAGPSGSGRTGLLGQLAAVLSNAPASPIIVAGGMVDGRYVAAHTKPRAAGGAIEMVEAALGLAGAAYPLLGLVAQVSAAARAAARLVAPGATADSSAARENLVRCLRVAAQERPVVCLIDDCDEADGRWWSDLLLGFATEVAASLRVFLFLSVEGGSGPGAHRLDEPDAVFAARHLIDQRLAEWLPIRLADPEHLLALTGPAERDVVMHLCALTDRRSGWATELWGEWLETRVVERDTDLGAWRFAPGQPAASASVTDVARARVRRALGDDLITAERAWTILGCAALEGRYFTAEAVALTVARDRDEVIDLLDELADSEAGLLDEVGFVEVADGRGAGHHLARYRFSSPLLRPALARFGAAPDQRKQLTRALAKNLERLYAGDLEKIATRLSALYAGVGGSEEAATYRRLADGHMPADAVVSQARELMSDPTVDTWDGWQCRRASAMLLLAGAYLRMVGPLDEVVAVGRLAASLARRGGTKVDEARALTLQGSTVSYMGARDSARAHLEEGAALWRALRRRDGEADCLRHLAWLDGMRGHREPAMEALTRAIQLSRELDDRGAEFKCHLNMVNLAVRWKDLDLARQAIEAAEELAVWGTPSDQASMYEQRGVLAAAMGQPQAAITEYERAAGMYSELEETRLEASAARGLGIALAAAGDVTRARHTLEHAIVVCQSMENLSGAVEAHHALARLEATDGRVPSAREHLERCRVLYRELGQDAAARRVEAELAELETGERAVPPTEP